MHSQNVIFTEADLAEAVEYFLRPEHDAFVWDVETMGEHRNVPTQNVITWIALATYGRTVVIPMGHPNGNVLISKATRKKNKATGKFEPIPARYDDPPQQLRPSQVFKALEPLFFSDKTKVAHNATFDIISVAKYFDAVPAGPFADTIVRQWLLNENLPSKRLKELTTKYYQVKYDHENVGRCVEAHPFWKVAHYAYMDAKYTWLLWLRLNPLIDAEDLRPVCNLEDDITEVESFMGVEGAPIDISALVDLEVELSDSLEEIEAEIYRAANQKFNINSGPQLTQVLYAPKSEGGQGLKPAKLTEGGHKRKEKGLEVRLQDCSTDAESLESHPNNPVVKALVEYQEVSKLLGTYVQGWLGVDGDPKKPCRIFDGKIYTDLVQYGTVTGRFSSRAPNLQNVPAPGTPLGKKVRSLVRAPAGESLVVADYGQIEMVVLAHYAGPGPLYYGIQNGMDPHSATAAALAGIDPEEFMALVRAEDKVAKQARQVAKGINFAVVYGAAADKVASMASISVKEAERFLKIHEQSFPEIYACKDKIIATCRSRRPPHIRTLLGRKRRLPAIYAQQYGHRKRAERQAVNSLIQGSAADLIKLAMIRLNNSLEDDMRLILSVHDELVTICPEEKAERCAGIVREAMLGEGIQKLLNVPMSSDVKVVKSWDEAK